VNLTTAQAAAKLGVSQARVRAMIAARRLKATLYGKTWLTTEKDLEAVAIRKAGRPRKAAG
jgi:excisionase family DNA binding protein